MQTVIHLICPQNAFFFSSTLTFLCFIPCTLLWHCHSCCPALMASEDWMWQSNGSVHTCQAQAVLSSACEAFLACGRSDWGRRTPGVLFNCCKNDFNRQIKNCWEDSMMGEVLLLLGMRSVVLLGPQRCTKIFTQLDCCNGWYEPFRKVRLGVVRKSCPLCERAVGMYRALPWGKWWASGEFVGQDYQVDSTSSIVVGVCHRLPD